LANVHKLFKHSGSFAATGSVTMPYTFCTGPLLLANSFMQSTRGGVSPQQLTVSVWKRSSNEAFDLASAQQTQLT